MTKAIQRVAPWNKTEGRFVLEFLRPWKQAGEILNWEYEPVKFRLGKSCTYTPDFMVVRADLSIEFYEIKHGWKSKGKKERAGWQEDSRVKFKVCADKYPYFVFKAAVLMSGGWEFEEL